MKSITTQDLQTIQNHLLQKPFKYEEVFDEVLDHYATSYEQSDDTLDQVLSDLDNEFTYSKINSLNAKYFDDLRKHLRQTHWSIFFGNFKWPNLLYTLACVAGFILISPILFESKTLTKFLFGAFGAIPTFLGLYFYLKWGVKRMSGKTKLKNAHAELFGMAVGFSIFYMQIPTFGRLIYHENMKMLELHPLLTAGLLLIGLVSLSTSMKMIMTKIKPAIN
ncbi:MAG: hypothetical protein RIA69_01195 [Cyclobacteriaceae bacterium]